MLTDFVYDCEPSQIEWSPAVLLHLCVSSLPYKKNKKNKK